MSLKGNLFPCPQLFGEPGLLKGKKDCQDCYNQGESASDAGGIRSFGLETPCQRSALLEKR